LWQKKWSDHGQTDRTADYGPAWVSRYQKDKISLDLNEARDDRVWGWQWHQLDHMQTICTSLHTDCKDVTTPIHILALFV